MRVLPEAGFELILLVQCSTNTLGPPRPNRYIIIIALLTEKRYQVLKSTKENEQQINCNKLHLSSPRAIFYHDMR
jgi:hypothetical protein